MTMIWFYLCSAMSAFELVAVGVAIGEGEPRAAIYWGMAAIGFAIFALREFLHRKGII